jgi:hypothetical protein
VVSSNGGVIIAARAVSWEAFMAERVDSRVLMSSDSVVVGAMLAAFDLSRLVAKSRSLWFQIGGGLVPIDLVPTI